MEPQVTTPTPPCSPYVFDKGRRIAASSQERVQLLREEFHVTGDSGRVHTVVLERGKSPRCDCRATVPVCSCIVAVAAHKHLRRG